jgi:hypothetical protein
MVSWADDYVDNILDNCWEGNYTSRYKKENQKAKKMAQTFQRGDIVRKINGRTHIEVTDSYGNCIYGKYLHTGLSTGRIDTRNLVKVDEEIEQKGNGSMKGKLFKVKADGVYGIGLAVDSTGQYVLEMKDGSGVRSFAKKEVEVVMPFTFSVQFNGVGTEYSYLGKEGTVKVGDLLLKQDGTKGITIAKVTAVNTKSDKATKYFDGVKIVTESIDNEVIE